MKNVGIAWEFFTNGCEIFNNLWFYVIYIFKKFNTPKGHWSAEQEIVNKLIASTIDFAANALFCYIWSEANLWVCKMFIDNNNGKSIDYPCEANAQSKQLQYFWFHFQ